MPSYRLQGGEKEVRKWGGDYRGWGVNSTACRSRSSRVSCPCLSPCWKFSWRCRVGCMKVPGLRSYKRPREDHNRMLGSCCSHTASCPTNIIGVLRLQLVTNLAHLVFLLVIAECSVTGTDWGGGSVLRHRGSVVGHRSSVAVVCWLVALNMLSVISQQSRGWCERQTCTGAP